MYNNLENNQTIPKKLVVLAVKSSFSWNYQAFSRLAQAHFVPHTQHHSPIHTTIEQKKY